MTAVTWILAGDSKRARIFETRGWRVDLQQVEDIRNPASRVADSREKFAQIIADFLDRSRAQYRFDRLRLALEPNFAIVLRNCLSSETRKLVYDDATQNAEAPDPFGARRYL